MTIDNNTITAQISFYQPPADGSRPYFSAQTDPKTGKRLQNYGNESKEVSVENVRGREDTLGIDTAGFQFFKKPTKVKDFTDDKVVERDYYPESIEIIKELTGASRVVLFDHTIRRRREGELGDNPKARQPANGAHVDQTFPAAEARVHRHLPADEVPGLLKKRFQIINLWRPISHPAHDWPLALCDFRTVDVENDVVPVTLVYPDREGQTYGVKYNPNHKWKYLKGMDPDELVLIKCAESIRDGSVSLFTPHTGFKDPTTPDDAPPRESIELRALVFYD